MKDMRMFVELDSPLELADLAYICDGKLLLCDARPVTSITTDSRGVVRDTLFIAVKGERFDGHDYIGAAIEAGASCALCERIPEGVCGNLILVGDTVKALGAIAGAYKERISPLTVAVTGSVGKTTTKEFIYAVLSEKFYTHKTEGNFNNEIGLPLTLLHLSPKHGALVLELGMSFKGEISRLTRIARPDIALITNIGSCHIENLGSREGIRDAKLEILEGLREGGHIILNADEPLLGGIAGAYYVGERPDADMVIKNIRMSGGDALAQETVFDISAGGNEYRNIVIPAVGEHNARDAAYAFAVGLICGESEQQIRSGLQNFRNTGMRQKIYKCSNADEYRSVTIIEDCYNSSPEAVAASLAVLARTAKLNGGRAVAVLGDMLELGSESERLHYETGLRAAEFADSLITYGPLSRSMARGALDGGMKACDIIELEDTDPASSAYVLRHVLRIGDTVLFKASRAMALERVIELYKGGNQDK